MLEPTRYEILERIASGGMGEIFRARLLGAHGFEKTVAVKRILPTLAGDPRFVERFIAEAKLAVALSHANIVQVLDLGRAGEELLLAMEFVDGADLRRIRAALTARRSEIPVAIALYIASEVLRGLTHAHERRDDLGRPQGVIHCDVSPSNLLVSYAGGVKIADFGVAQAIALAKRGSGPVVGKLRYLSPEMLAGRSVDARADLYALAVVLYELLTGVAPFDGRDTGEIEAAIRAGPPPIETLRGDLPPGLSDLLRRAMSERPASRPTSAQDMRAELQTLARVAGSEPSETAIGAWLEALIPRIQVGPTGLDGALHQLLGARGAGTISQAREDAGPPAAPELSARTFIVRSGAAADGTHTWQADRGTQTQSKAPRGRRSVWPSAFAGIGVVAVGASIAWLAWPPSLERGGIPPLREPALEGRAALAPALESAADSRRSETTTASSDVVEAVRSVPPKPTEAARSAKRRAGRRHGTAWLNVHAEPWAEVSIDGEPIGSTPLVRYPVKAGPHRLRFVRPDGPARERTVDVAAGETRVIDVEMDARP